jgi:hypothetical protein
MASKPCAPPSGTEAPSFHWLRYVGGALWPCRWTGSSWQFIGREVDLAEGDPRLLSKMGVEYVGPLPPT